MLKVLTVVGARPQFVKAAVVSAAIAERNARRSSIQETLVHTGQHYDARMSDIFFEELGLAAPLHNLNVGSGTHAVQTAGMMRGLEPLLREHGPDIVLIYGDTNSTLAATLTAAKLTIPLAHVEAGLRSRNMRMPEEINRIVADRLSDLLFTGSAAARENLAREGLADKIVDVGDVMIDAIRRFSSAPGASEKVLHGFGVGPRGYALATVHRAENTDDEARLRGILAGLQALSRRISIILPLHPRAAAVLQRLGSQSTPNLKIVPPVSYLQMLALERHARLILTDSGGVQKEAYCLGVPCVTLRGETEWVETLASGWNRLCGCDPESIGAAADAMLDFDVTRTRASLYGDGHAGERIVDAFLDWHNAKKH